MKVLFVGLGAIGQRHLRNIYKLLGDEIDVIAWRVRKSNEVVTDTLEIEHGSDLNSRYPFRTVATLQDGLAERPAITFVCNPSRFHVSVALAAVRAGSHVFIEKPLSDNLDDVETLILEAEHRNCVGYVGYQLRFHPAIRTLEHLLARGAVGRVLAILAQVGEYLPNFHRYEDYRQTYASRGDLGGGVILSQIHEPDYLVHLFGMPRRLFAVGGHLSDLEIDVEDVAVLLMDCGTPDRPFPVSLQMDFLQNPPARICQVVGDRGKILMDLTAPSLVHYGPDGVEVARHDWHPFARNQLFLDELRHFLAVCRGEETARCPLPVGLRSLQIALAARRSIETGTVTEIAPWEHDRKS
jgi:predicted dehydrogenase